MSNNKNKIINPINHDIIKTLNITIIFTNPLNNNETITHREVISGIPQTQMCNKPFGWETKTIIELNYNGSLIKKDLTIYHILFRCTNKYESIYNFGSINKAEVLGPIIGCDPNKKNKKPNHNSKGMEFKTRSTLILDDKSEFTYTIKFKILKPIKCIDIFNLL